MNQSRARPHNRPYFFTIMLRKTINSGERKESGAKGSGAGENDQDVDFLPAGNVRGGLCVNY